MKNKHILFLFSVALTPVITHTFSVQNSPFAFERRYNANSFILNGRLYYERYKPKEQALGDEALEHLQEKKDLKKQKKARFFTP